MHPSHHDALMETIRGALAGGAGWWVFSSAVRTMPPPNPLERWYGWLFRFCQLIAANHDLRHDSDRIVLPASASTPLPDAEAK